MYKIKDCFLGKDSKGLTAISFVKSPAICQNFTTLAKNETVKLNVIDKKKREVVSPIMIPNQLILRRNNEGEWYYIRFSEDFINECATLFYLSDYCNNVTIEHPYFKDENPKAYKDYFIKGVKMTNLWLSKGEGDYMSRLGYNLPKGTLCCKYQIKNEELWKLIESGEVKGLSIELECKYKN